MKVHEYNEMMAYMLRPQPKEEIQVASLMDEYLGDQKEYQKAVDEGFQGTFEEYLRMKSLERKELAIGGGVIEGEDLGTREGFNNISKSEASFKFYEDKFGKKLLDEMAQEKYGKNFRDLDKNNQLKFFKSQLNKYEDFIKENKRYPNPTEAYNIGLTQGGKKSSILTDEVKTKIKNIYTSGEGGSTYISKKLAEEGINIDDSTIRRFITAEEEAGNIVRPTKFKTQEPDPDLPKDRYNKIRKVTERDLRGFTVGRSGTEVLAPEGSKYKITFNIPRSTETTKIPPEYQGTQYYKTKAQANKAIAGSKKFSKDLARQAKANKGLREIILEEISDTDVEREIVTMKEGTDLATAHRASYKQVKKLGELYNILNLGVEAPGINSGAIRKFENKLDNLYKEQNNLIRTARRSTNKGLEIPKNIQERIDNVNKEISTVVDLTNQRVQGILVDAKTLKPYTYGINYIKTYGMGFLDNKPVKDITDEDLKVIEDNLKYQIAREKKLAKGTESFLRDRQELLKYTKELSEPGFLSKIPARLRPIALGTGFLIAGTTASRAGETGEQTKEQNPSLIEEYPYLVGTTAAASPLLTKTGRKIYGGVLKGGLKAFGSVPSGLGFSASQFVDINPFSDEFGKLQEDPNVGLAGADLLLPELGKRVAGSGTGILAKAGRFALNPFQALEGLGRFGRAGRIAAMGARIPTLMTPVGLGLMGIEGVMMGMREQERINQMRETDPEAYQEYLADQEDMLRESAAYGGRMGFDEGGPSDPSKRKFMKIMGGLTTLPFVGKFFRVAEQTPVVQNIFTEIQKLKNSETIMPDWFPTFLDKFRREGVAENIFKKKKVEVSKVEYDKAFAEGKGENYYTDVARTQEYKANNPDHMDYYKLEDTDQLIGTTYTNEKVPGVKVDDFDGEVSVNWENDYSQPVSIEYVKPGAIGPDMGRVDKFQAGIEKRELKPEGEFAAVDQEVYATDPDGGFDTNAIIVQSLDDMMEGTTRVMEEYATGNPVRTLSKGEGKVIEAEVRAEQAAESAAEMADDFGDFE